MRASTMRPVALDDLLSDPFLRGPALDANRLLGEARARRGERAFSFEAVVPADASDAWLRDALLPKLVYLCESRGAPLPACAGVVVSLFCGDELRCFEAAELIGRACARLGVTPEALVQAHGTGELRHAVGRGPRS